MTFGQPIQRPFAASASRAERKRDARKNADLSRLPCDRDDACSSLQRRRRVRSLDHLNSVRKTTGGLVNSTPFKVDLSRRCQSLIARYHNPSVVADFRALDQPTPGDVSGRSRLEFVQWSYPPFADRGFAEPDVSRPQSAVACRIVNRQDYMYNPMSNRIQGTDDFTLASDGAETDILISTARFACLGGDRKT
jgi:hypothetical protein